MQIFLLFFHFLSIYLFIYFLFKFQLKKKFFIRLQQQQNKNNYKMSTIVSKAFITTTTILWIWMSSIYGLAVYGETFNSQPERTIGSVINSVQQLHEQQQQPPLNHLPLIQKQQQQQKSNLNGIIKQIQTKRSWQNLQGSWGKRSSQDLAAVAGSPDYIDDLIALYEQQLQHQQHSDKNNNVGSVLDSEQQYNLLKYLGDVVEDDDELFPPTTTSISSKRAWKSMTNGGWGKRLGG